MKDADLVDLVKRRRDASVRYLNDTQSSDRREALQFYRGDNLTLYGDSGNGLSTVVSRDVLEAVESMLPGLIKPFVAGDEAVRFEPSLPDDEDGAKQATVFINNRFTTDNSAFRVVYDFAKDGLLYRLGIAKVVYEEVDESEIETLRGLDRQAYEALDALVRQDKSAEILDDPVQEEDGTITCKVKKQKTRGTYRVHIIAPDEFIHEDRLASLEDATFLGHRKNETVGDLIAMGLDKKKCEDLQGIDVPSQEADERHGRDEFREDFDDDDLARKVTVSDCYLRCDYDGTGTLQWRRVIVAGNENELLLNEPAEDHPFVAWTPIPIPHKLIGSSIHDVVRDIQMQKTAVVREAFNALYLSNRPQREVVEGQVNIEDLLNPSVGGIVRVKGSGMIREIPSGGEGVAQQSLAMVEYMDGQREQRTGSTRYNQGMDANSLNKTATGISIIQNASTQRLEAISRHLAEAMMGIFRKMLALVSRYADKKEIIRVQGKWVEMDPADWRTGYDMSVSVGLGTGNKDQMAAHITNLMEIQKEIGMAQQGMTGPVVTWENVYEAAKRLTENLGLKGVERYFTDPAPQGQGQDGADPNAQQPSQPPAQPQEPPPVDPLQQAQMDAELEIKKARIMADAKIEVGRIDAEANVIIATIKAGFDPQAQDDYQPDGAAGLQGDDSGGEMPPPAQMPPQQPSAGDLGAFS